MLANTTDEMADELVDDHARFIDPHTIEVGDRTIRARAFVIATGASTVVPEDWRESFGDAILTVKDLFELEKKLDSPAPKPGWLERLFTGRGRGAAGASA